MEGELESVAVAQLKQLATSLGQQGAVLVIAGAIPDDVESLVTGGLHGAAWPTRAPDPVQSDAFRTGGSGTSPSAMESQGFQAQEQDTEQVVLMLGCPTVPLGHPDALALRLLQTHLGMGMSSRLFVVMREERGLAYDVGASLPARCGAAPFVLHLSTSKDRAEEATTCLLQEWQRLLEQPLEAGALDLARAKYLGQDAMGRQTSGQIAERLALLLSHGLPADHVERCLQRAPTLTGDQLQAAARRWLGSPHLSVVGPAEALRTCERAWRTHSRTGQVSQTSPRP